MIKHFRKVRDNLYRGAEPSVVEVISLAKKFGIEKIISLDKFSGMRIAPVCNEIDMNHVIIDIDPENIKSLQNLLQHNVHELLDKNVPTFVHCYRGKDRTGLVVALARCIFDGWDCKKALTEAKKLGYGTGLDFPVEKFYTKLICKGCSHDHSKQDSNHAYDIVSNIGDNYSMYRDEQFNPMYPSWAPFVDKSYRTYPEAFVTLNPYEEQYQTRENYGLKGINKEEPENIEVPAVGVYDQNTSITNLVGPSLVGGGFV